MSAGKVALLVFGIIFLLVAVGLMFAGGTLIWVDQALKDDEGFITTDDIDLEPGTPGTQVTHAIITRPADIDLEEKWVWGVIDLATIKVEVKNNNSSKQVFIGIAKESDVEDYLNSVSYNEITEFRIHPYRVYYEYHAGSSEPEEAPTDQEFWEVSSSGAGTRSLEWELESGTWVLVLMNADGSAGIDLSGSIGIKVPWIIWLGIGLLIGGIVVLIIGVLMVYFAARRPMVSGGTKGTVSSISDDSGTVIAEKSNGYPASLDIDYPDRALNRLSTFFRIIWIIPIAIILGLVTSPLWSESDGCSYQYAAGGILFLPIILMLLFRQKYPRWWFDWNVALTKFAARVYAYLALLRDEYPSTDEDQAVHIEIAYPDAKQDLNRWLPLVKWFLAIPHYFVLFFLSIAALVYVVIAWFAILFTGRYPRGLFDFVAGLFRWYLRVAVYAFLLTTDRYPPFSLSE